MPLSTISEFFFPTLNFLFFLSEKEKGVHDIYQRQSLVKDKTLFPARALYSQISEYAQVVSAFVHDRQPKVIFFL